ncbi:GH3 auxin-responsive promoter family protein [Cellulophaga sp. E16_2]|uniref:GH3 auxin-responsive promoter n=1 Tax=Cellulophaga algicola (strain DSM 14237 / IC166 / ACAM 630) TaxID=688270 RepID=E6XB42_CELAD|nr:MULTISPECIES: GH3 auxin-responsive promoter family protein [Cellulophaga]ADV48898.1 GH3 auxin-responsive promoter [Cellulophaga algicola DSM 14237]MBO0591369.1 GH3 auxin-responsive promoter family protein [Cellulophaga sp. E16_2]
MSIKSLAAKIFARRIAKKTQKWVNNPIITQEKLLAGLIETAKNTTFGKDHDFSEIKNHADFIKKVPVRDYEELKPYVEKVVAGESDILWPNKPIYFAKTSGTTSGAKYIPITETSIKHQVEASRNAILNYIDETGKADFVTGKMIFLQGSPVLTEKNGVKLGRLSGISAHYVPNYLQKNRLPSWETNCIEDWDTKVNTIVNETIHEDMTVIAGIPSWVQMYFEKLNTVGNKKIGELFKNFNLFIYGGVNYEPYRAKFENLIGRKVDSIELFPASEGFFAYQNSQKEKGMLLLLKSGIFYEFIKSDEFFEANPKRITIKDVEIGINYVMIISTDAGLWAYNLGDTVQFTSLKPYKIIVSGRIKHFISAFGEHVIGKEVESAMQKAIEETDARVNEFTVAPQITPELNELPYHEWFIEFEKEPSDLAKFISILDLELQQQNSYYFDLIDGKILQTLKITSIKEGGFHEYMKSIGKLGGQNKVQRLSNDRNVANELNTLKR